MEVGVEEAEGEEPVIFGVAGWKSFCHWFSTGGVSRPTFSLSAPSCDSNLSLVLSDGG